MKRFMFPTALMLLACTKRCESFAPTGVSTISKIEFTTTSLAINTRFHASSELRFQQEPGDGTEEKKLLKAFNSENGNDRTAENGGSEKNSLHSILRKFVPQFKRPPPLQIEDTSVLFYDVFLIINLSLSISFWVVHRLSFSDIVPAFSEGSLLCILWVIAGLWNGAFLYSAVDGHYDTSKVENEGKGGPVYAAILGLSTMVTTSSLRILVALAMGIVEHREVGFHNGEELIPLEIAFGLLLMPVWRMLHSSYSIR